MLDRTHTFAHRQPDILGRHVVLEIDESLGAAGAAVSRQFLLRDARASTVPGHGIGCRTRFTAKITQRVRAGLGAIFQHGGDAPKATACARNMHGFGLVTG